MTVLKVGDPGDARKRETPAIKLCALKEQVDAVLAKCLGCGSITSGQERLAQALTPSRVVKSADTNYLNPRQIGKWLNVRRHCVCADKEHHLQAILRMRRQRLSQIYQVVVTARAHPVGATD
jgi:hypothetical protein